MTPTQEQIEVILSAGKQTLVSSQSLHLDRFEFTREQLVAALTAAAALSPDKRRDEIGYVPKDDPRLDTIIGPPRSPDKRREE